MRTSSVQPECQLVDDTEPYVEEPVEGSSAYYDCEITAIPLARSSVAEDKPLEWKFGRA